MKARKKCGFRLFAILIVAVVFSAIIFSHFGKYVKSVLYTYCDALLSSIALECINDSASDIVALYEYADFVSVEKDANGDIKLISTNTGTANGFVRSLALRCENALNNVGEQTLRVPIGAFTGSPLLSNKGPVVKIKLTAFSSVECDFLTTFESVGINQTRHSIFAVMNVDYNTVLPIAEHAAKLTTNILIAECVIVGKIPEVYVGSSADTDYLDLIP